VEMVWHNHKRVQKESPLTAIAKDRLLKQCRSGRNLKEAATLRCHSGDEISSSFLWSEPHPGRINEKPEAKTVFITNLLSGASTHLVGAPPLLPPLRNTEEPAPLPAPPPGGRARK